jgi:hypothetical protein
MTGTVHSKDDVKLTTEFLASGKWVIPLGISGGEEGCTGEAGFYSNNCEGGDYITGWVFGEFVKIK